MNKENEIIPIRLPDNMTPEEAEEILRELIDKYFY